jgi:hypothetical protein
MNEHHEVPGDRKTRRREERDEDEGPSRISTHRSKGCVPRTGTATQCLLLRLPRTPHAENAAQSPSEMDEGRGGFSSNGPCRRLGRRCPPHSGQVLDVEPGET